MRIVFIDMHCINFLVRTYKQIKQKNKIVTYKHKFILDYALANDIPVCSFITGKDTEISNKLRRILKHDKSKRISVWEHSYVMRKSFSDKLNVLPIVNPADIKADDIVIGYFYKSSQLETIKSLTGHKMIMGNHFVSTNKPVDLDSLGIEGFINEIDLSDNTFVNKYIKYSGKYIVCPYMYASRFQDQLRNKRINKMMAIGTLSTCKGNTGYELYREMYHTEWIQLMRKEIFDKAQQYPDYMDSYISYIYEDKIEIKKDDPAITKIIKKAVNRFKPWKQAKYMSFDIVDKFNEYLCFACPEETVGMPGIGFVEGMACGTAYIGLEADYYRKLGLIPGIHYISYNGSFDDLLLKIKYCQNNVDEARKIGVTGRDFVRKNFNSKKVAADLFAEFREIASGGRMYPHE